MKQICFDKYQDKISGQARSRISGFGSFQYKKLFVLRAIITEGNEEEREKDMLEHSKLIKLAKEQFLSTYNCGALEQYHFHFRLGFRTSRLSGKFHNHLI